MARWVAYFRKLLKNQEGLYACDSVHLPEKIDGSHWTDAFLRNQAKQLRQIERKTRTTAGRDRGPTLPEFIARLTEYLRQEMRLGRSLDQALEGLWPIVLDG